MDDENIELAIIKRKGGFYTDTQYLKKESLQLEKEIKSLKTQLNKMPEGKIVFSHTGKYCKWYQSDGKSKNYIPKKKRYLAEQLAMKKYLQLQLENISYEKKIIDNYLSHHSDVKSAEQLLAEASEYQALLSPYFTNNSKEFVDWQQADYGI